MIKLASSFSLLKYAPSHEIHHASSFGIGNSNDYELDWSLIHPMALETQLLGISRPELLERYSSGFENMGRKRAIVVAGPEGLDEAGLNGTTKIALLENGEITLSSFTPEDLGMEGYAIEDIRGGNGSGKCRKFCSAF